MKVQINDVFGGKVRVLTKRNNLSEEFVRMNIAVPNNISLLFETLLIAHYLLYCHVVLTKCPPMIIQQTSSVRIQEPVSVLSFVLDVGPLLLISLSFSTLLFFCWYFGVELTRQRKKQRLWLVENEGLIQQYKVLHHLLESFGQRISSCRNCKNDKMQLWDYQQHELLVVRCRSCKMNYTFTKEHNELMQLILFQMEGVVKLVNTIVTYRYHSLGKLLVHKLAIDLNGIKPDVSPLEVMHFTARKKDETKSKSVMDIFLYEWEVVIPDRSELLVS